MKKVTLPNNILLQAIHSLQKKGILICIQQRPLVYRHVNYWNELGIILSKEDIHKNELLEEMKRFEQYVIEILNMCTDFDIHKLYKRLTVFLQGANKSKNCLLS